MGDGTKCIKYLIFGFNFIFFLSGCGLLALGIWLNVERDDWEGISDYDYVSVANVIIAAGAIICIVAFLGCCGAITENRYMLLVFFILLLVIFIMELGAGIAAYVWRGDISDELRTEVEERIPERYYTETGVRKAMDSIQEHFECCGVNNITDWAEAVNGRREIDSSCCILDKDNVNYSATCKDIAYPISNPNLLSPYYKKGCFDSIEDFLEDNLLYVGICAIIFAVFQIIGMIFAMILFCSYD